LRRNCLLKQGIEVKIEGKIEVTRRRERRHKQLLDDLKEKTGYWKLKEVALDRAMWRTMWTCRKTDYRMNELKIEIWVQNDMIILPTAMKTFS
jgi:hypothetical protein